MKQKNIFYVNYYYEKILVITHIIKANSKVEAWRKSQEILRKNQIFLYDNIQAEIYL